MLRWQSEHPVCESEARTRHAPAEAQSDLHTGGGDVNKIKGNQSLSLLHVNLDKDFFTSAIGQDDAWSERVLTAMQHQHPFSAV